MKIRPFKKWMLLDYKPEPLQSLNTNGLIWLLTIREVTWWGLVDREKKYTITIPFTVDVNAFYSPKLNVWNT